jgi:hypothetical protein
MICRVTPVSVSGLLHPGKQGCSSIGLLWLQQLGVLLLQLLPRQLQQRMHLGRHCLPCFLLLLLQVLKVC